MVLADGYLTGQGGAPSKPRLLKLIPNATTYPATNKFGVTFTSQNIDDLDILGLVVYARAAGSSRGGMVTLTGVCNGSEPISMYGQVIVNYYEAEAYGVVRLLGGSTVEIEFSRMAESGYPVNSILSVVFILKE